MDRSSSPDAPVAFGPWLVATRDARRGEQDADVPCGTCTACCRASQFVEIGPDEHDATAHIPTELLFPAPGRPGHLVMGYDERGHCPMLRSDGCSIYAHRPQACRTYDCRVFAATGVEPADPAVAERVRRWTFVHATDHERADHAAVQAAVVVVRQRLDPAGTRSGAINPTQLAVQAIDAAGDVRP